MNTLEVGSISVTAVLDASISWNPARMWKRISELTGDVELGGRRGREATDWEPYQYILDAHGELEVGYGGYLIRSRDHDRCIIVDLGIGPGAHFVMDPWGEGTDDGRRAMITGLAEVGVHPNDVTDVVFTHLHDDHVGWASTDGRPTFPNATYRCEGRDWDYFHGPDTANRAQKRIIDLLNPVDERMEMWDGDSTLFPGFDVRLTPGHTPGSSVIVLSSGTSRALILGDTVHCPVELLDEEWAGLGDVDPVLAQRTRISLMKELEGKETTATGAHFSGLQFGRVLPGTGRRQWQFL